MDQLSIQWQDTKELTGEQNNSTTTLQFKVPNVPNPIWILVDTPHLFKNIRNNLLRNDIEVLIINLLLRNNFFFKVFRRFSCSV